MNLKDISQSKTIRDLIIGFGVAIIALVIFQAGVMFGYHRALFSARLGDNYYRAFGGHRPDFYSLLTREELPGSHGAVGKIVSVDLPTFIVAGPDKIEKVVMIGQDTIIRRFRDTAASSSLAVNDSVVVLGAPNDQGQIEARLIRIIPQ